MLIIYIEIYETFWIFCGNPIMTSIIVHTGILNTQENVSYILNFFVLADVHFSHFDELKSKFFTSLHFDPRVKN